MLFNPHCRDICSIWSLVSESEGVGHEKLTVYAVVSFIPFVKPCVHHVGSPVDRHPFSDQFDLSLRILPQELFQRRGQLTLIKRTRKDRKSTRLNTSH